MVVAMLLVSDVGSKDCQAFSVLLEKSQGMTSSSALELAATIQGKWVSPLVDFSDNDHVRWWARPRPNRKRHQMLRPREITRPHKLAIVRERKNGHLGRIRRNASEPNMLQSEAIKNVVTMKKATIKDLFSLRTAIQHFARSL